MLEVEELLEICEQALKYLKKAGAQQYEVQIESDFNISVSAEMNEVAEAKAGIESRICVRCVINKSLGFAMTNSLKDKALIQTAEAAVASAKIGPPDKYWVDFPTKVTNYPQVNGLYDKQLLEKDVGDFVAQTHLIIEKSLDKAKNPDITVNNSISGMYVNHSAVMNSLGLENSMKNTAQYASLSLVARVGDQTTPGCFDFVISRDRNLNYDSMIEETVTDVKKAMIIQKVKPSEKIDVLLSPLVLGSLFDNVLTPAFLGDNLIRGTTPLTEKLGEQIVAETLTIEDDGLLENGGGTAPMDDEGVPSQKTTLIENGILKNFLFDHYWGTRQGKSSTGNGIRLESGEIYIRPRNFHIKAGNDSFEDLIDVKEGYLVKGVQGAHTANSQSGEFSVVLNPCYLIRDGDVKSGALGGMISGNIYDFLTRTSMIGNKTKTISNFVLPYLRIKDVPVSAKE
ncbi:MAG: TldD/PmbA family protein [Candidatus Hodarchaeota archaeon]